MVLIIVLGSISAYVIGAGFANVMFHDWAVRVTQTRDGESCLRFFSSALWPITVLAGIGAALARPFKPLPNFKNNRLARKQEREIAAAKHEAEVARIKRIAAEELDRELAISRSK